MMKMLIVLVGLVSLMALANLWFASSNRQRLVSEASQTFSTRPSKDSMKSQDAEDSAVIPTLRTESRRGHEVALDCGTCGFDFLEVAKYLRRPEQSTSLSLECGFSVTATNKGVIRDINVFDTANPTGGDFDLGSPHATCGGDSRVNMDGGRADGSHPNCVPQGKALVIQDLSSPEDTPNDNYNGGCLLFEFDLPFFPVTIGILDVDGHEKMTIELLDSLGLMIDSVTSPTDLGGNSLWIVDAATAFGATAPANKMRICTNGSFAITFVEGCRRTTSHPTLTPTKTPTSVPTASILVQTSLPSPVPTSHPHSSPTQGPSTIPTILPTIHPSFPPTSDPTSGPTSWPIAGPSPQPSNSPTHTPTITPFSDPSAIPTSAMIAATDSPTLVPTLGPSSEPSSGPSPRPSKAPALSPTRRPTEIPTSKILVTTQNPSEIPTSMILVETRSPFVAIDSTEDPTEGVSSEPILEPSLEPSASPTLESSIECGKGVGKGSVKSSGKMSGKSRGNDSESMKYGKGEGGKGKGSSSPNNSLLQTQSSSDSTVPSVAPTHTTTRPISYSLCRHGKSNESSDTSSKNGKAGGNGKAGKVIQDGKLVSPGSFPPSMTPNTVKSPTHILFEKLEAKAQGMTKAKSGEKGMGICRGDGCK